MKSQHVPICVHRGVSKTSVISGIYNPQNIIWSADDCRAKDTGRIRCNIVPGYPTKGSLTCTFILKMMGVFFLLLSLQCKIAKILGKEGVLLFQNE